MPRTTCCTAVSDRATCKEGAAKPSRHSNNDIDMMHKAHGHKRDSREVLDQMRQAPRDA
jgi:hypothetical protein